MWQGDYDYRERNERTPTFVRVVKPAPLLELHDIAGKETKHYVSPAFIARVSEVSETKTTREHTLVTLFDGKSLKVREAARHISQRVFTASFPFGG